MPKGKSYPGRRAKMPKKKSKKLFRKTSGSHKKNTPKSVMRGGIRL